MAGQFAQFAIGAHDVEIGAVVHGVVALGIGFVLLFGNHEGFGSSGDFLVIAGQADDVGMKIFGVFAHHFGCVAVVIKGYENSAYQLLFIFIHHLQGFAEINQGGGADIRAVGISEKHHADFTGQIGEGDSAFGIMQCECSFELRVLGIGHLIQIIHAKADHADRQNQDNNWELTDVVAHVVGLSIKGVEVAFVENEAYHLHTGNTGGKMKR